MCERLGQVQQELKKTEKEQYLKNNMIKKLSEVAYNTLIITSL